jgi:hypothetical protein
MLFYNANTGAIATGTLSDAGIFTGHHTGTLSTGWTHIDPCGDELLFYNAKTGAIATGTVSDTGTFTGQHSGRLSIGWTQIAPGTNPDPGLDLSPWLILAPADVAGDVPVS